MSKSTKESHLNPPSDHLLGNYSLVLTKFQDLDKLFEQLQTQDFKQLGEKQKSEKIHQALSNLIENTKEPCFLLAAVIDFIEKINQAKILESYSFAHFELWLNQFSHF